MKPQHTVMLFAAGRGERMRPLTDHTPKPLLEVGGKPLIAWQIERLRDGGFRRIVINLTWLGEQIEQALGDGVELGVEIVYSREPDALETAGGIVRALPLLGDQPFAAVSADIYTTYDYSRLARVCDEMTVQHPDRSAHLVLVDNPAFHPQGDMALQAGRIRREGEKLTYANFAVFHPALFADLPKQQKIKLFPWLYGFADQGRVTGEHFRGVWENLGTPDQLQALNRRLADNPLIAFGEPS